MKKQILIVEDDLDDRELLEEAITSVEPSVQLAFTENGKEALAYLYTLKQGQSLLPDLIILDLNMPYIDGIQTYKKLNSDDVLRSIPIAVFTSSQNPNERAIFERMGVSFIAKPHDFTKMYDIVRNMLAISDNQTTK